MVLLAAASSMSACIIPVAPEFQDPPSDPPGMPYFVSASPAFGTLQTFSSGSSFSAVVSDTSPGTTLWFRWALDYPTYTLSTRVVPQEPVVGSNIPVPLDCSINPDPTVGLQHQLYLIVADQQFDKQSHQLETLQAPGHYVYNTWQVDMSCNVGQ